MKRSLLTFLLLSSILSATAQYNTKYKAIVVGAEAAVPASSFMADTYYGGLGGTIGVLLPVGSKDAFSVSTSGFGFLTKADKVADLMFMGMLGYRCVFHMTDKLFYIEPKAGVTLVAPKKAGFTYSAGIGHKFAETLDLSLRYQSGLTKEENLKISFVGLNLSYNFDLL